MVKLSSHYEVDENNQTTQTHANLSLSTEYQNLLNASKRDDFRMKKFLETNFVPCPKSLKLHPAFNYVYETMEIHPQTLIFNISWKLKLDTPLVN